MAEPKLRQDYIKPKAEIKKNLVVELFTGTAEKTVQESPVVADSLRKPYNPDDLWQKTGDHSIYDDMKTDDQVSVALQLKKDLVVNAGWDIVQEDEDDTEIRDELEVSLREDPDRPLEDMVEEIMSGFEYGFSLSEKLFKKRDDGKITLKNIKTRFPDSWLIDTDKHGNISEIIQQGIDGDISVDPKTLIHYVNKGQFQNPYGTSDLRAAYSAWFTKRHIIRYYAIFLEKNASPTPIGRYDLNAPKEAVDDLLSVLKKFQAKTALVVPKEMEVEFLESKSKGEAYINGINIFNMFIGRSLLIPDLLGFQGEETAGGSYALGKEQIDIFLKHIQRRRNSIERLINNEIIKPIVIANFGFQDNYPKFVFNPIKEEDSLEFAKTFLESVKAKGWKANDEEVNHFRRSINYPEGDVQEAPVSPGFGGGFGGTNPQENPFNPPAGDINEEEEVDGQIVADEGQEKESFQRAFKPTEGDFKKNTDVKAIQSQLEVTESNIVNESQPLVDEIFEDLFDQIERKDIIKNNDASKIETIKLKKLKSLKQLLKKNLRDLFVKGKLSAQSEVFRSEFTPVLPEEAFLSILEQEMFDYVGDWAFAVTKGARIEMINAIKDGRPLSSVIDMLNTKNKKDALVSIERFARTKSTEVMNKGRQEFFNQSKVVNGFQYSAILDGRTTIICSGLHGKKFVSGKEPVPPMHFNCRSILLPITIFQEFTPDETVTVNKKTLAPVQRSSDKTVTLGINEFINKTKGEGFPVQ